MPKTKRRIDKKNAITFKVVNRSQRDPLIADENAPQHVLVEETDGDSQKRREKQVKYGIYFDDDYDYLQHLTDVRKVESEWEPSTAQGRQRRVMLPSSLFASNVEEDEGMLNKAVLPVGPQPDWDPEVVAAMDDDFDFECPDNIIDDDFVAQANGPCSEEDEDVNDDDDDEEEEEEDEGDEYEEDSEFSGEASFTQEETKSRFTNYSMTSSVMRRNHGLKLLDEKFETLYEKQYAEETDIGALDLEEIGGSRSINDNEVIKQLLKEAEAEKNEEEERSATYRNIIDSEDEAEETCFVECEETGKNRIDDRFDCESILSTYSNLYNHPKLICEPRRSNQIKIDSKTGVPLVNKPGLTAKNLKQLDALDKAERGLDVSSMYSRASRLSEISIRPKEESAEERKVRKAMVKEYRKERRLEKKANKLAFKLEEQKQNRDVVNIRNQMNAMKLL